MGDAEGGRKFRSYVAVVLDESGSMMSMRREAMDAFNEQVKVIREMSDRQETLVSLVKFNTSVPPPVYWNEPVDRMVPLRDKDYKPAGMTAMLDAVGFTATKLSHVPDADDEDVTFLLLVISDGYENNSKSYSSAYLAELIGSLDRTGRWTFTYLGANQDLSRVSAETGIPLDNMAAFEATPVGMSAAAETMSGSLRRHLEEKALGVKSSRTFYREPVEDGPGESEGPDGRGR